MNAREASKHSRGSRQGSQKTQALHMLQTKLFAGAADGIRNWFIYLLAFANYSLPPSPIRVSRPTRSDA